MEFKLARLEKYDDVRPTGVKVAGKTAIPAGRYEVVVSMSNRFKRLMPELVDVPNFSGIRIHGGNTSAEESARLNDAFRGIYKWQKEADLKNGI